DLLRRGADMHRRWYPRGGGAASFAYQVALAAMGSGRHDQAQTWIDHANDAVAGDHDAEESTVHMILEASRWAARVGHLARARTLLAKAHAFDRSGAWADDIDATATGIEEHAALLPDRT
ncbi:MAG TPA: hypothetical protein VM261_28720, partial [Kofleriaceae bacterium]|nr:hypothetical protein [Kofleriaceae bacterium]